MRAYARGARPGRRAAVLPTARVATVRITVRIRVGIGVAAA